MRIIKRSATILAACLLVVQHVHQGAVRVAATAITSQYLGAAPSQGNEHLLLFKLPETISSKLLESQQSLHSNENLHQQQQKLQHTGPIEPRLLLHPGAELGAGGQQSSFFQAQAQPSAQNSPALSYYPAGPEVVQEQAVSLTIPLSTLHPVEQQGLSSGPQLFELNNQVYAPTQTPQQTREVALELALADYLNHDANQPQSQSQPQSQPQAQLQPQLHSQLQQHEQAEATSALLQPEVASVLSDSSGVTGERNAFSSQNQNEREIQAGAGLSLASLSYNQDEPLIPIKNYTFEPNELAQLAPSLSDLKQANADTFQAQEAPQPSLWRDTQSDFQPHYSSAEPNYHQASQNQSDISSLLTRLSSSSPDLLIRLKNLLRRAAAVQGQSGAQSASLDAPPSRENLSAFNSSLPETSSRPSELSAQQPASESAGNSELLMANNVSPSELKNMVQSYMSGRQQQRQQQQQSSAGQASLQSTAGGQNSLSAFLSNQNVTSHEEIKIPLIVIAMPRVVSLKRNQLATSATLPSRGASKSSIPLVTPELAQRLMRQQLPHMFSLNSTTGSLLNGTGDSGQPQTSELSENVSANGSQVYWVGQQQQQQQPQQQQQQQQQQQPVVGTTSIPIHTMAPYAHQFVMPRLASAPLISNEFIPIQPQQQLQQLQPTFFYPSQERRFPSLSNETGFIVGGGAGQIGAHFRPLIQTMIVGGPQPLASSGYQANSSSMQQQQQQQPSSIDGSINKMQIQLINPQVGTTTASNSAERSMSSMTQAGQNSSGQLQFVPRNQQSPHETQKENEPISGSTQASTQQQQQQQQHQHQQQRIVFVNSMPQRRVIMPTDRAQANYTDETSRTSAGAGQKNLKLQQRASSRLLKVEEQIGKLRPLFQTGKRGTGGQLSASQMLMLLSRSAERRLAKGERSQQFAGNSASAEAQAAGPQRKKAPKMLLMIV